MSTIELGRPVFLAQRFATTTAMMVPTRLPRLLSSSALPAMIPTYAMPQIRAAHGRSRREVWNARHSPTMMVGTSSHIQTGSTGFGGPDAAMGTTKPRHDAKPSARDLLEQADQAAHQVCRAGCHVLRHQFPGPEADGVSRKNDRDRREDHEDEIEIRHPELHDSGQNADDKRRRERQPV